MRHHAWLGWLGLAGALVGLAAVQRAGPIGVLLLVPGFALWVLATFAIVHAKGYPTWMGFFCLLFGGPLMAIALWPIPRDVTGVKPPEPNGDGATSEDEAADP